MATIKSFTSVQQSRKLAEILPLESADMQYISFRHRDDTIEWVSQLGTPSKYDFPCWSLAALLDVLPKIHGFKPIISLHYNYIAYSHMRDLYAKADNPVDACYEMIIRLSELKVL